VGQGFPLQHQLISLVHNSPIGGHSRAVVTSKKLASLFYWRGLKRDVKNYVRACGICKRNKPDLSAPVGFLQPLPIPEAIWVGISMEFIEGLPKSRGKDTIFVVVDRLSKYVHFLPLTHPFTAVIVGQLYFEHIYKLHGLPRIIVSDKDKIFLSNLWTKLFSLQKVALRLLTTYHPQSDGQTEAVNRCLEGYLTCMTGERPLE